MRAVNPGAQALREARGGLAERFMVWIEARNRASNAVEALGLWTGEDTEDITALDLWTNATATRTYAGRRRAPLGHRPAAHGRAAGPPGSGDGLFAR